MKQHWLDSLLEALTNTGVGFLISVPAQYTFCHVAGIPMSLSQNMALVAFMTVVSVLRQYVMRRLFDGRTVWQAVKKWHAEIDDYGEHS